MPKNIPPIEPDMQGEAVANLQSVLLLLFKKDHLELSSEQREVLERYVDQEVHGSVYGRATTELVRAVQRKYHMEESGVVDEETAGLLNEIMKEFESKYSSFMVNGTIRYPDKSCATGLWVQAFDKDLRSEELLGKTTTNQSGEYTITYSRQQFKRAEKKNADLIVRVSDLDSPEQILAESAIIFNVPETTTIDLAVEFRLSEFERLLNALSPLLQEEDVSPTDLTEGDIGFLAHETGFEEDILHIFVAAVRITVESKIDIDLSFYDIAALFYGLGRKGESLKLAELLVQDFYALKTKLKEALDENIIPAHLSSSLDSFFTELDRLFSDSDLEKPASHIDVQQKNLRLMGTDIPGLDGDKIDILVNKAVGLAGIDNDLLSSLVEEEIFQEDEAKKIGLAVNLYQLFDENIHIVRALHNISHIKELTTFKKEDWQGFLQEAEIVPPCEMSSAEYAALLAKRIEKIYPGATLQVRCNISVDDELRDELLNPEKLINRFPGLELADVIKEGISLEEQISVSRNRINLLDRFHNHNSEIELLSLDYMPESKDINVLDLEGFSAREKKMIFTNMKARQRLYSLTGDVDDTKQLMENGYYSAVEITYDSPVTFQNKTGFSDKKTQKYYGNSERKMGAVTNGLGAIIDTVKGGFLDVRKSNMGPDVNEYLKKLKGYEELFGNQTYCHCKHCRSILSPAAYFVDMMKFVEDNILDHTFSQVPNHLLHLKNRRPDLWTLDLTCKNTDTLVPTLDIINEILENYIYDPEGKKDFRDRREVEKVVYSYLYNAQKSFQQPFVLPLKKLQIYLKHFDLTRADIAWVLNVDAAKTAQAVLDISDKEYELISTKKEDPVFLRDVYGGLDIVIRNNEGIIEPFDVQKLLEPMGLSRKEMGELVGTAFVRTASQVKVKIKAEKTDSDSVQNDVERIKGLTYAHLDRMHRFTRLCRKLPWSIRELDLVLFQFNQKYLQDFLSLPLVEQEEILRLSGVDRENIDNAALVKLEDIADFIHIQKQLELSVEQSCALWVNIAEISSSPQKQILLDRLFNAAPFGRPVDRLPSHTRFVHPFFTEDANGNINPSQDNALFRLCSGLSCNEEELFNLINQLSLHQRGIRKGDRIRRQPGVSLNEKNLTLLYRHALLARQLDISIDALFRLITFAGIKPAQIENLDNVSTLLSFHSFYKWWKEQGYSLDDMAFITGAHVEKPDQYLRSGKIAREIIEEIQKSKSFEFADTLFAFIPGMTEELSREIIKANSKIIKKVGNQTNTYRISTSYKTDNDLIISEEILNKAIIAAGKNKKLTKDEIRKKLKHEFSKYHAGEVLTCQLATKLNFSREKTRSLIAMTGVNLFDAKYVTELQPGTADPKVIELEKLVNSLLPLSVLFRKDIYDAGMLGFIFRHKDIFQITDFSTIARESIQHIAIIEKFAGISDETNQSRKKSKEVSENIQAALINLDHKAVAKVLGQQPSFVLDIKNSLENAGLLPKSSPDALQKIAEVSKTAAYLGVGGGTLLLVIISDNFADISLACDALLGAFRAKYSDDKEWKEKSDPYEDLIRSRKRDALTDYLINSFKPKFFISERDLYQHFLIDVELTGCARTSKLVAAISSMQIYVHRVLMNLEQSQDDKIHVAPNNPGNFIIEWEWRKNYRVWEANRKVFLFPETYIEPELRDNKTPLFEELESTLLQQEVNEQNVLDAYASYMTGFEEVAGLKIAGSYHDKGKTKEQGDILHLFGVTPADPPVYYYRTVDNLHYGEVENDIGTVWNSWRKIEVQIPVRKVSPIVFQGRLYVFWVEIVTTPENKIKEGTSIFIGYKHKLTVKYTMLRLDDTWTIPQEISLHGCTNNQDNCGVIIDPLVKGHKYTDKLLYIYDKCPKYANSNYTFNHVDPDDSYTLTGFLWDQVYFNKENNNTLSIFIAGNAFKYIIDFYSKSAFVPKLGNVSGAVRQNKWPGVFYTDAKKLAWKTIPGLSGYSEHAIRSILISKKHVEQFTKYNNLLGIDAKIHSLEVFLKNRPILEFKDNVNDMEVINGSMDNIHADINGDLLLLQGSIFYSHGFIKNKHLLKRLGTTCWEDIGRILFSEGIDELLDIKTQKKGLGELPLPINVIRNRFIQEKNTQIGRIDFTGPYGTYYREIFFHIPFLIANHLNSQQKFEAAQKWYRYIFDPTANDLNNQENTTARDVYWRYLEFRNLDLPKLREILTDKQKLEVYKNDPFNPHAIARLRLTAYQKSIVMKYIDNLLDWGDKLFSQFTMESVNEATMLYIMAADILGDHPVELGDCGETDPGERDYEHIKPLIEKGSEFLNEVESFKFAGHSGITRKKKGRDYSDIPPKYEFMSLFPVFPDLLYSIQEEAVTDDQPLFNPNWKKSRISSWARQGGTKVQYDNDTVTEISDTETSVTVEAYEFGSALGNGAGLNSKFTPKNAAKFTADMIRQLNPVFCYPVNKELLSYWDRVDDRLYKIRHCMDIKGVRRKLALFSPEIDPRLLVRAKAAGLSIEDVLDATSGDLPPYRFEYLIQKAKSYAGTVQSFGASLLSALEKKDTEELNRLRLIHEQNIQKLTTKAKEWEIKIESESIETLQRQQAEAEYTKAYYESLIDEGLSGWESLQQDAKVTAYISHRVETYLSIAASVASLNPQYGSPFSLNFGGKQLSGSLENLAKVAAGIAVTADETSSLAGLEAGNQRREQSWKHQLKLAEHGLKQIEKKLIAAEIRRNIAKKSLELHKKSIEQSKEMFKLYGSKFSNFGLYTWLSKTLHGLHRDAYNSAFSMARLAEQAYRFERGYDSAVSLGSGYWEASKAGLLSGERLLIDLQHMEQRFIETNRRILEINQSFSLAQIAPTALIALKEGGSCKFTIGEIFFDLFYPGHYLRKIKAVRLSIPCVTGPYTNVSATLRLKDSSIRIAPSVDDEALKSGPCARTLSIATSSAQNDAGVFELNFHDERYMPFEGAGAISRWQLNLPSTFHQFDYETISDVLIHISYTAEEDGTFRETVEDVNATREGAIMKLLNENPLPRVFSLRHEFSNEFHRLLHSPTGNAVTINITETHFPFFLQARALEVKEAKLLLKTAENQEVSGFKIKIDGNSLKAGDQQCCGMPSIDLGTVFANNKMRDKHTFVIEDAGSLSVNSGVDPNKLEDILLSLSYTLL